MNEHDSNSDNTLETHPMYQALVDPTSVVCLSVGFGSLYVTSTDIYNRVNMRQVFSTGLRPEELSQFCA